MTDSAIPLDFDQLIRPRMPDNCDVPIGCIGAGFIMADCHLVAYRQAGFNPTAIASRSVQRARDVAARHQIPRVHEHYTQLLDDPGIEVVDVAVPPDIQLEVIEQAVRRPHLRGILAQKPLGPDLATARRIVELCESAGKTLCVNQNMRYDQSIRGCQALLARGLLGDPVLATINMRAIPHWMPWQERQGWVTLRIMSIHHLDTMRFLFGDPVRVFASVRSDPRTARKFAHRDGICLYVLEYESGLRASAWDDVWVGPDEVVQRQDVGIEWRVEGTMGLARGTIGWPDYPARCPSTLEFASVAQSGMRFSPQWEEAWFPDAFAGPMCELMRAIETAEPADLNGRDNLATMGLVEACYLSAGERRMVELAEVLDC